MVSCTLDVPSKMARFLVVVVVVFVLVLLLLSLLRLVLTTPSSSKDQAPHETVLRIYEESTEVEGNEECIHCDCCKCIGWHHHPVNKKQWHFIVHTDFKTRGKPELAGKRVCQLCCCAVQKARECVRCVEKSIKSARLSTIRRICCMDCFTRTGVGT